ncbi:hypothetical protein DFJ73DRAFT_870380 [Zopfochytrium polystomum]|nr:hypothetical protein DFJ73DRAFT_870380 [Zopfochytrium polystomum]
MSSSVGCNEDIAGILLTVVIAGAFREQMSRIDDRHLQASIWTVLALNLLNNLFYAFFDGLTFTEDQQDLLSNLYWAPTICMGLEFALLSYHTSYRALLLMIPSRKQVLWIAASLFALVELALHSSDLAIYALPDGPTNPIQVKLSITTASYNCIMETFFFCASQYRIVTVMREMNNAKVGFWVYFDCIVRCFLYSGSMLLFFMTAGGWFYDSMPAWIFGVISYPMMLIVLLTDCDRVRKLVSEMQKRTSSVHSGLLKDTTLGGRSQVNSARL